MLTFVKHLPLKSLLHSLIQRLNPSGRLSAYTALLLFSVSSFALQSNAVFAKSPLISVLIAQVDEPIWIYSGQYAEDSSPIRVFKKNENYVEDSDEEDGGDDQAQIYKFKKSVSFINLDPSSPKVHGIYWIKPSAGTHLTLQIGTHTFDSYRGNFLIRVENTVKSKFLQVINVLSLEQYLAGVVASEMPSLWPVEALKAQAIIARTYALFQILKNRQSKDPLPYDLIATSQHQVYGGVNSETKRTDAVIAMTEGTILTNQNETIEPFFYSHSGGQTEVPKNIWNGFRDYDYLERHFSPECNDDMLYGKAFCWGQQVHLRLDQITSKLKYWFDQGQQIASCSPLYLTLSNRIRAITFFTTNGEHIVVPFKDLVRVFGSSTVGNSLISQLKCDGNSHLMTYKFRGSGHGVGLSQYGAYYLAQNLGFKFDDILNYYYSRTQITSIKAQFKGKKAPQKDLCDLVFYKKTQF